MPKWLRKSFVVMVTILTFGLVTPSQAFLYHPPTDKNSRDDALEAEASSTDSSITAEIASEFRVDKEELVNKWLMEAEEQSYIKFGSKIKPVIEDEFKQIILPNIEAAIQEVASAFPEESLAVLDISESPSGGNAEKIFHIYNRVSNEDVIRFHVRKDHPPQSGYWFNFHYHTVYDNYQTHHDLGSIYWNTNTPPKWMS